tara:strand:+ start:7605 stop:9671 length:2067 start_codon:yes stop_codon:yes gene_type:complete
MPRKYTKSSEYWDRFQKDPNNNLESLLEGKGPETPNPITAGEGYYVQASSSRNGGSLSGGENNRSRYNRASRTTKMAAYNNIAEGILPYDLKTNYVTIRDAILLCQKAYGNIPIFRNAVDVMAEFSNSEVHLEGSNESSRKFVRQWFERINLWKLKDQYFREYYRSGNVFFYRLDGKFTSQDFINLNKIYGSKVKISQKMPVRYILLNPFDFIIERATSFDRGVYKKILNQYDLERLQTPKTEEDSMVFESLDSETQELIRSGSYPAEGLNIELDPEKLCYSFYKKQDYEPFAIPFGWPVLDDLNWKIELKKIDQAISRTIENVILLVTMGAPPDKGGINPHNMAAMQNLFRNESVGRVLVADYTSKAEFVIPDIQKVIGPEKYEIVNQDIREGLQNIIVGRENYSSTQIKAQIFLERLKESREAFIKDFLQPEIKRVCKQMGFKTYPKVKFEDVDLKDEVQLQRVVTRLMELGILSPEQGIHALKSGLYPQESDMLNAQEQFSEQRERGLWNPLVGGVPPVEAPGASAERKLKEKISEEKGGGGAGESSVPDPTKRGVPPKEAGRPPGSTGPQQAAASDSELFSIAGIQKIVEEIQGLELLAAKNLRKKYKKKRLTNKQSQIATDIVKHVVLTAEMADWEKSLNSRIENPETLIKCTELEGVLLISENHKLELYPSALLYHGKNGKS